MEVRGQWGEGMSAFSTLGVPVRRLHLVAGYRL